MNSQGHSHADHDDALRRLLARSRDRFHVERATIQVERAQAGRPQRAPDSVFRRGLLNFS